jgi:hypothetical protein
MTQTLIVTDDDNTLNATVILLDDEPPEPKQEGYNYTGGWKLVTNLILAGDRDYNGTSTIAFDQIFLVKQTRYRKGDHTDYITIEKDEDRELRNMKQTNVYLIWWQNLVPQEEFLASKMIEKEKKRKKKN